MPPAASTVYMRARLQYAMSSPARSGRRRVCSPRHKMSFHSANEGLNRTGRASHGVHFAALPEYLEDIARHDTGCRLAQQTRVQNAIGDAAGIMLLGLYSGKHLPGPAARSMLPASQLSGLSGSGLHSITRIARHTECKVHAGLLAAGPYKDSPLQLN